MKRGHLAHLPIPPLLLITDRGQTRQSLETVVGKALDAGCRWLLFREKDLPLAARRDLAEKMRQLTQAHGALLLLSNDLELAAALGADGVQLSRDGNPRAARNRLGPGALIGRSAHDTTEAAAAFEGGADYVTLSPVFPSTSKPGYGPVLGLDGLAAVARRLSGPVIALGGVTAANGPSCLAQGAAGLAVMGEVMRAAQPEAEVAALLDAFPGQS